MNPKDQLAAFGAVLGYSEGTDAIPNSQGGYKALVGGTTFDSYAAHPQIRVWLPRYKVWSTAAGRYQFIYPTWKEVATKLGLPDFSPESQDAAMVEKVRERGGYDLLVNGKFDDAVAVCAKEWASLPGAGYGQREVALDKLRNVFTQAGGVIT